MRGLSSIVAMLAMVAAWPGPVRAQEVPERWISEWGEGVCKLARARGDPPSPYFMFELVPGSESLELWLVNPEVDLGSRQRIEDAAVSLGPGGEASARALIERYNYRGDRYYVVYGLSTSALDHLTTASSIRLDRSERRLLEMALPDMSRAVPVLRQCVDDQLRRWGLDPAMYNALQRPPRTTRNMASLVSSSDYPIQALSAGHSGRSVVRVTVGADAAARDCRVIQSSGHVELDRRTCDISRRASFAPALDAEGRPTEAVYVYSIRWMIR